MNTFAVRTTSLWRDLKVFGRHKELNRIECFQRKFWEILNITGPTTILCPKTSGRTVPDSDCNSVLGSSAVESTYE